jgi:hypothetical protein
MIYLEKIEAYMKKVEIYFEKIRIKAREEEIAKSVED